MNKLVVLIVFLFCLFSSFLANAQTAKLDTYWDDIDFSDSTLVSNQAFRDKLIAYLYEFANAEENLFDSLTISGLDLVFAKAKTNMSVYGFVLELALNGYSGMGRSKVTDYLLNYPQLAEGEITMDDGLRLDSITEPYQKVRVGARAPDFSGMTIDGKLYSLYTSAASRIIVFFWSSDCEYCHDFLNSIRRKFDLQSDYELVTFALADDVEEVKAQVKNMRLPGYHFYDDKRWDGKVFLDFHITSTPTVFVLDKDKTIVCKPYDWKELKTWIKEQNNK